jgi:hypothetical protein
MDLHWQLLWIFFIFSILFYFHVWNMTTFSCYSWRICLNVTVFWAGLWWNW